MVELEDPAGHVVEEVAVVGDRYWLIGDLSRPVDASLYIVTVVVLAGFFLLYLMSHSLNLIAMGEDSALMLGVEVPRVKAGVYLLASLMTGAVVSVSGPIAYIGLICPHMVRLMFGSDNRILFPAVNRTRGIRRAR